jgi:hypothetical protein
MLAVSDAARPQTPSSSIVEGPSRCRRWRRGLRCSRTCRGRRRGARTALSHLATPAVGVRAAGRSGQRADPDQAGTTCGKSNASERDRRHEVIDLVNLPFEPLVGLNRKQSPLQIAGLWDSVEHNPGRAGHLDDARTKKLLDLLFLLRPDLFPKLFGAIGGLRLPNPPHAPMGTHVREVRAL